MAGKAHTSTLIRALKATLKSRSITYDELARRLKLSHANGTITTGNSRPLLVWIVDRKSVV